ncbi:hypothetical protein [Neobacillus thermocopriae]|nr:hypothetical protein [Neobacillus thermocopriae]MED3625326.1 hypothetical protein [Neobacillus thermocopriae]MED3715612.1 hypothetical protein [Neobacillus thermocopriae]
MMVIDIDHLLENTQNLTVEKNNLNVKIVEIDQLLDKTKDW